MKLLRRGTVLRLENGVIVALLERKSANGWDCMIVGSNDPIYSPGSWDIFVFDKDLESATEIELR